MALTIGTISTCLFIAGVIALVVSVRRVRSLVDRATLVRLPCRNQEQVTLNETGNVTLLLEESMPGLGAYTMAFHLWDSAAGEYVPSTPRLRVSRSRSVTKTKRPVATFTVRNRGAHVVVIEGAPEDAADRGTLVFERMDSGAYAIRVLSVLASLAVIFIAVTGIAVAMTIHLQSGG